MEAALKLRLFAFALVAAVMASSLVEKAAASDAPAPSPTSDAAPFAATALASFAALALGFLFH